MKVDELFKAIGDGLREFTTIAARLIVDIARAIVLPFARAPQRMRPEDDYSPLTLRVLLYVVLFGATLTYYRGRQDLANLVSYGFWSPEVDAAADGFLPRSGELKPGLPVAGSDLNPTGEVIQGLVSQNLTQFLTSSAMIALALLLLFEAAYQLGRRANAQAYPSYERDAFLGSVAGLLAFGFYLTFIWGPFLGSAGVTTDATSLLWRGIYAVWDGYVALFTGAEPPVLRRIEIIEQRFPWWFVLAAFFVLPAALCFVRLIVISLRCAERARAIAVARVGPVRRRVCRAMSVGMPPVLIVCSLFVGSIAMVQLSDALDPSRNLTIEAVNLYPEPGHEQNGQILTFIVRNGFDHAFVIGPRGPRLTVRIPARERCWDAEQYEAYVEGTRSRPAAAPPPQAPQQPPPQPPQQPPPQPPQQPPPQLGPPDPEYVRQIANRRWLPPCAALRARGVDFPFDVVAIEPADGGAHPPAPAERAPTSAYVIAPGASALVLARERLQFTPNIAMRCGFERLVPAGAAAGVGPVHELQVRVAIVGGRQQVSSDFRPFAAVALQSDSPGGPDAESRCRAPPPPASEVKP